MGNTLDSTALQKRHHVEVTGGGPVTFVLAHGLASNQTVWAPLVERLARDSRVVTFDYAGAGRSDPASYDPIRYGSLEAYAADLGAIVDAFGGPTPVVVGHSISGAIALLASSSAPQRFQKLVLLAPSPRYLDDPPDYRGGFTRRDIDDLLRLMEQNFIGWATHFAGVVAPQPDVSEKMLRIFEGSDPRSVRTFAEVALTCDIRSVLPRVQVPALVVQCADDAIVPDHVGEWMAKEMPGGAFRRVPIAGHFPHLSDPALIETLVRDFAGGR